MAGRDAFVTLLRGLGLAALVTAGGILVFYGTLAARLGNSSGWIMDYSELGGLLALVAAVPGVAAILAAGWLARR